MAACLKHQEQSSAGIEDRQHSVRMVLLPPGDHLENLLCSPGAGACDNNNFKMLEILAQ